MLFLWNADCPQSLPLQNILALFADSTSPNYLNLQNCRVRRILTYLGITSILAASVGRLNVPRLSIIIPFTGDEVALEATLVSVLENRPADCEILISHDGSYRDPYSLGDEVLFIETAKPATEAALLNEALRAAISPVLHILRAGVQVKDAWFDEPLRTLTDRDISMVLPIYLDQQSSQEYSGLDLSQLWCRKLVSADESVGEGRLGPLLAGCFIRRRVLLALDGLRSDMAIAAAEAELGLALRQIGAVIVPSDYSTVQVPNLLLAGHRAEEFQAIGEVVAQYDALLGGVGTASHFPTLIERILGSLSLARLAATRSFMRGYRQLRSISRLKSRLDHASQIVAPAQHPAFGVVDGDYSQARKAA